MSLAGKTIRNIHILESLGAGGMGEVYLGFDDNLRRQVAVKVLRGGRRLNEESRLRLQREAQTLSSLDHPHICRIYDLIVEADSDCLVLELVRGRSLRAVMNEPLSHRARLNLALQIASALESAHSKQIVHRDLKPDNIMVTKEETVKVLDFGLARHVTSVDGKPPVTDARDISLRHHDSSANESLNGSSTGSMPTQEGVITGTPMYMSPEQARGEPVNTSSDMYSLGLLMQEFFTGEPPFDRGLPPVAMVCKVRRGQTRPVRGLDAELTSLIQRMENTSPELRPTAAEVVVRLQWMLEAPKRRVRRHLTMAFMALLLVGVVTTGAGFYKARRAQIRSEAAERDARLAQQQAEAVHVFLSDMLTSVQPDEQGVDVKMIDVLTQASASLPERFPDHPGTRAAVLHTLGCSFRALGQYEFSHLQLQEAFDIRKTLLGPDAPKTLDSLDAFAITLCCMGQYEEAEKFHRQVVETRTQKLGQEHQDTLASSYNLASAIHSQGRYQDAIELLRNVLAKSERLLGANHHDTLITRNGLALLLAETGQFEEALQLQRLVLDARIRTLGPDHSTTLNVKHNMASSLKHLGRMEDAEKLLREVFVTRQGLLGEKHPDTLRSMNNLASLLRRQGKLTEAQALLRDTLRLRIETLGRSHPRIIRTMINLASVLTAAEEFEEAEDLNRDALALAHEQLGDDHPDTLGAMNNLAAVLRYRGKLEESEQLHRQVLDLMSRILGREHRATFVATRNLATVLQQRGKTREAEETLRQLIHEQTFFLGRSHSQTTSSLHNLAVLLWECDKKDEATALYREAAGAGNKKARTAMERLGLDIEAR